MVAASLVKVTVNPLSHIFDTERRLFLSPGQNRVSLMETSAALPLINVWILAVPTPFIEVVELSAIFRSLAAVGETQSNKVSSWLRCEEEPESTIHKEFL